MQRFYIGIHKSHMSKRSSLKVVTGRNVILSEITVIVSEITVIVSEGTLLCQNITLLYFRECNCVRKERYCS